MESECSQLKEEIFGRQKDILYNGCTLSTDAQINTILQKFSLNIQSQSKKISGRIRCLENEIRKVNAEVSQVLDDFLAFSDIPGQAGEFVASDKDIEVKDDKSSQSSDMDEIDGELQHDDEFDASSMRVREDEVIQLGLDALNLFNDPQAVDDSGYFDLNDDEDGANDWDGDHGNAFQDQYASSDVFNQRPLPFIIGSRAFVESASGE